MKPRIDSSQAEVSEAVSQAHGLPLPEPDTLANDLAEPLAQLLTFLNRLQYSALLPLRNQQRSKHEVESREADLSAVITLMSGEVRQGIDAVQAIQHNLSASREGHLVDMARDLSDARNTLEERQTALKSVMTELELIGRQLSMLAMNAKIEASRAGESEAGFSVVADEVKRLARTAMEHSAQAATLFDLSIVNNQLGKVVDDFQQSNAIAESEITNAFDDVVGAFSQVDSSLSDVSEHYAVITEVAQNNENAIERSREKLVWANQRTEQAVELLNTECSDACHADLEQLLLRDGVHCNPDFDRLENIKREGKLRVAIEPSFIGLSFRPGNNGPLMGLDVEYAQALAKHLDVRCEFVEAPWDTLTELLHVGRRPDEAPADLVLSALPASDSYEGVAYSETYTYLDWVLARRVGDTGLNSLADLDGKRLGIINDPGAFDMLQRQGVRWKSNQHMPGGTIFLKDLIAYSDQSRIHDCLAEGVVDAFGVDLPIYHWACSNETSPWHGKIEICSDNVAGNPYYYCIAVAAVPGSYQLLQTVNRFIEQFLKTPERQRVERHWQGAPITHTLSYRDEPGNQLGEAELKHLWAAHQKQRPLHS